MMTLLFLAVLLISTLLPLAATAADRRRRSARESAVVAPERGPLDRAETWALGLPWVDSESGDLSWAPEGWTLEPERGLRKLTEADSAAEVHAQLHVRRMEAEPARAEAERRRRVVRFERSLDAMPYRSEAPTMRRPQARSYPPCPIEVDPADLRFIVGAWSATGEQFGRPGERGAGTFVGLPSGRLMSGADVSRILAWYRGLHR